MCFLGTFSGGGNKNERGGETERLDLLLFGVLHLRCKWHWSTTSPKYWYAKRKKKKKAKTTNNNKQDNNNKTLSPTYPSILKNISGFNMT